MCNPNGNSSVNPELSDKEELEWLKQENQTLQRLLKREEELGQFYREVIHKILQYHNKPR
jgi:hypothetical protein